MKLSKIIETYGCKVYGPETYEDREIKFAFCSDLMSDALIIMNSVTDAKILEQSILITGLTTVQSIRTAEMLDVNIVMLVRGKVPSIKVEELAKELNILVLTTEETMFNLSGKLYQDGIKGIIYNQQW